MMDPPPDPVTQLTIERDLRLRELYGHRRMRAGHVEEIARRDEVARLDVDVSLMACGPMLIGFAITGCAVRITKASVVPMMANRRTNARCTRAALPISSTPLSHVDRGASIGEAPSRT